MLFVQPRMGASGCEAERHAERASSLECGQLQRCQGCCIPGCQFVAATPLASKREAPGLESPLCAMVCRSTSRIWSRMMSRIWSVPAALFWHHGRLPRPLDKDSCMLSILRCCRVSTVLGVRAMASQPRVGVPLVPLGALVLAELVPARQGCTAASR